MSFDYLDKESQKLLHELINNNNIYNEKCSVTTISNLVNNGYVVGVEVTTLRGPRLNYRLTNFAQKGKTYFEMKEKYEKR